MSGFSYYSRKEYHKAMLQCLRRSNVIFVIGARVTGKSSFAARMKGFIQRHAEEDTHVGYINFERCDRARIDVEELVSSFHAHYAAGSSNVFLVDEVTHLIDWENGVNEVMKQGNVKIVFFSSTRSVVSDKLDAVREGSYEIMEMLPFSLSEFIAFHGFKEENTAQKLSPKKTYLDEDDNLWTLEDIYNRYSLAGGLPVYEKGMLSPERCMSVADGAYCAMVTHDILEVGCRSSRSAITDPLLLRCIITIMAKNVGAHISATWVGKQTYEYLQRTSSTKTIESYMNAVLNANLFHIAERLDIVTGQKLKTLPKYYMVDTCLHNFVTCNQCGSQAKLLENQVFFELMRMGCRVYNGKLGASEVTFVAENGVNRAYVQVVDALNESNMRAVLQPLRKIKDNYPKMVVCREGVTRKTGDGIFITNGIEFLMGWPMNNIEK